VDQATRFAVEVGVRIDVNNGSVRVMRSEGPQNREGDRVVAAERDEFASRGTPNNEIMRAD
jgi:hypothetical protein